MVHLSEKVQGTRSKAQGEADAATLRHAQGDTWAAGAFGRCLLIVDMTKTSE
jgi:hypothetical protein